MSKILLISHIFPPAIDGGSRVIYKLGQQFENRGHQTLYLSSDCSSTDDFVKSKYLKSEKLTSDQLKLPVYHSLRRSLKFLNIFIPKKTYFHQLLQVFQKGPIFKFIPFLKAIIKILKFKPDLIVTGPLPTTIVLYAHLIRYFSTYLLHYSPKLLINSSFHPTDPDFLQKPLINSLKKADYLWTLTKFETNYFIKNFKINPKKIILAGNGVDSDFLKNPSVPSEHLPLMKGRNTSPSFPQRRGSGGRFNILFIGSLSAHKRVDLLINSFSFLLTNKLINYSTTQLIIAGQKTLYYPQIKKNINSLSPKIRKKIKFVFNFPQDKLAKLIDNCTFLVLPSIQESFGLVLIEAWARGKPVIVSDIPSLSELVNNTNGGLIFKKDNQEDLANKMKKLFDSPERCQQYGQNGLNYVKTNYTWEKVGQKICQKINLS